MSEIVKDGKLKSVDEKSQLFIIKDGKDIGYETEQRLVTDIDKLDIKVKESGFKDVRVTRLDDLYVSYIELLYEKDGEIRAGVPGQYLGDPLNLNDVYLKVYYLSDSGINFSRIYNVSVGTYRLCYRRGSSYYSCDRQDIVTDSSNYVEYSFNYNGQLETVRYELFSIKKFLSAEVYNWPTVQYTDTSINFSELKLKLTFQNLDETLNPVEEEKIIDFSTDKVDYITCSTNKTTWNATSTSQNIEITCTYLNDDEYDYDSTIINISYTNENIIVKCIDSIIEATLEIKETNKEQYFLSLPNLKCTKLVVLYNNGTSRALNATQRNKVSLYVPFTSQLHESNSGLDKYILNENNEFIKVSPDTVLTSGYTKEWHTVADTLFAKETIIISYSEKDAENYDHYVSYSSTTYSWGVLAEIASASVKNPIPNQYERTAFITNKGQQATYEVTYNNYYSIINNINYSDGNITIPKYDEDHYYYDTTSNRWNYYSSDSSVSINVTIQYRDINGQSIQVEAPVTIIKKAVESILNTNDRLSFKANSDVDLTAVKVQLNYNNGETEISNVTSIKKQGTQDIILKYDRFEDSTNLFVTEKKVKYDICYNGFSIEKDFSLTRDYIGIQAINFNNEDFEFSDEEHFQNRNVNLNNLNKVYIYFSDESKYIIEFSEDENKLSVLSNNKITLYKSIWGGQLEQVNYFIFIGRYKTAEKTIKFTIKIDSFKVSLKNKNILLYQGKSIEDSLKNDFNYTIYMLTGDGDITQERTIYNFDELSDYNAVITCTYDGISNDPPYLWPLDNRNVNEKFVNREITFKCVPFGIGDFDISITVEFPFYRVVDKIEIKSSASGTYSSEYITSSMKIKGRPIDYSSSDMGEFHRITFTNGFKLEDIESPTFLKNFVFEDGLTKDTPTWPISGIYHISYDENEVGTRTPYATVTCTNMVSLANRIEAVQINNSRIAGQTILLSDFDINVYGLCNEEVIPLVQDNLSISDNASSSTDESKDVRISYTDPNFADIKVSTVKTFNLTAKNCTINYEVYLNGYEEVLKNVIVAGNTSYTPSVDNITFAFRIDTKREYTISSNSIYSFSELIAYDKDTGQQLDVAVKYDTSTRLMTLPAELDKNLLIKINMSSSYVTDGYGHAYTYNSIGEMTSVQSMYGAQGTYRIPSQITTIPYGYFSGLTSLKHLIIGDNVIRIKDSAFFGCTQLSQITFECRTKTITIGRNSFKDCTSLNTLDFSACGDIRQWFVIGTPDDNPTNGNVVRNTWENCKLRYIKIKRESFTDILRVYYLDNSAGSIYKWTTARCPGYFHIRVSSSDVSFDRVIERFFGASDFRNSIGYSMSSATELEKEEMSAIQFPTKMAVRLKSVPTSAPTLTSIDGTPGNNIGLYISSIPNTFDMYYGTYTKSDTYDVIRYDGTHTTVAGSYDISKACAVAVRSDINLNIWVVCYGFRHWSDYTYNQFITGTANNAFTTNGRVGSEFVSVEDNSIGTHFGNWNNSAYVNDCIYPNIKLSSSILTEGDVDAVLGSTDSNVKHRYNSNLFGTYLDFMIPIYN